MKPKNKAQVHLDDEDNHTCGGRKDHVGVDLRLKLQNLAKEPCTQND